MRHFYKRCTAFLTALLAAGSMGSSLTMTGSASYGEGGNGVSRLDVFDLCMMKKLLLESK